MKTLAFYKILPLFYKKLSIVIYKKLNSLKRRFIKKSIFGKNIHPWGLQKQGFQDHALVWFFTSLGRFLKQTVQTVPYPITWDFSRPSILDVRVVGEYIVTANFGPHLCVWQVQIVFDIWESCFLEEGFGEQGQRRKGGAWV